jgi:hypothetical protein
MSCGRGVGGEYNLGLGAVKSRSEVFLFGGDAAEKVLQNAAKPLMRLVRFTPCFAAILLISLQTSELHRLLGKKTLEAEILKEALERATGSKKQLRLPPSPPKGGSR